MRKSSKRFFTVFLAVLLAFAVPFMQIGAIVSMENVKFSITEPSTGGSAGGIFWPDLIGNYTENQTITWTPNEPSLTFQPNTVYTATLSMETKDPDENFDANVGDIIDGFRVTATGAGTITLEQTYPETDDGTIDTIEFTLTAPKAGETLAERALMEFDKKVLNVPENPAIIWLVSDTIDGTYEAVTSSSQVAESGKYYKAKYELEGTSHYNDSNTKVFFNDIEGEIEVRSYATDIITSAPFLVQSVQTISSVDISLADLVVGQAFPEATTTTDGVWVETDWLEYGSANALYGSAVTGNVEADKYYGVNITYNANSGYTFQDTIVPPTGYEKLNLKDTQFQVTKRIDTFPPTTQTISHVDINVPTLIIGQDFPEPTILTDGVEITSYQWKISDTSDSSIRPVAAGAKVEATTDSKKYFLSVYGEITSSKYVFADSVTTNFGNAIIRNTSDFEESTTFQSFQDGKAITHVDVNIGDLVFGQPFPEATIADTAKYTVETVWTNDNNYVVNDDGNLVQYGQTYHMHIKYTTKDDYLFVDHPAVTSGYEPFMPSYGDNKILSILKTFDPLVDPSITQTISHVDITLPNLVPGQPFPEPKSLAGTIVKTTWQEVDDLGLASEVGATVEANKLYMLNFNISANTGYVFDDNVTITDGYSLGTLTDNKTISATRQFSTNTDKTLIVGSFDSQNAPNVPTAYAPTGTIFKNQNGTIVDDADDIQLNVATPVYDEIFEFESIFVSSMPKTAKNIEYKHLSLISIFDNRSLEFDKPVDVFIPYDELGDEFDHEKKIGVLNNVGEGSVADVRIENHQDGILLKGIENLAEASFAFYTYEDIISSVDISLADLEVGKAFPEPVINTAGVLSRAIWFEFDVDGEQIHLDDNAIVEAEKRYSTIIFLATQDGYELDINLELPAGFSIAEFEDGAIGIMKFADTVTAPTTIINSLNVTIDEPTNGEELPEAETTTPNVFIETNWSDIEGDNINNANYDENSYCNLGIVFYTKPGYEFADNIAIPEGYTVTFKSKFLIMLAKEYNAPSVKPYNPLITPTKPTFLVTDGWNDAFSNLEFIYTKYVEINHVPELLVNSLPSNAKNIVYLDLALILTDPTALFPNIFQYAQRIFIPYSELGNGFNESADIGVLHLPIRADVPISHSITKAATGFYIENIRTLSPFAFYTLEKTSSGSNRSNDDEDESADKLEDLLNNTLDEIKDSEVGGTVVFKAGSLTNNLPVSLMSALYEHKVNLVIDWNGGKDIIIPAGKAIKTGTARAFYSFEELADMYEDAYIIENPNATSTSTKSNPSTGARA